ncbi:MAG TPA: glycerol-3-phosphate dehydrogenase/oxidase [Anaeromyxobacteraceae bacterium]|nr:glycerol-3-phosphate dehydrogenase/oxidase [Anaeromyxobacteraceae bacterium]
MTSSALHPEQRALALSRLAAEAFDVLVIGGGVTGAGVALDAATRGLSVALVEARDLAAGTSSRSGKAFHGGLRYLKRLDLGLVREASRERNLMVQRLCPHLAWPTPFLYPLVHRGWERLVMGAGLALYDVLGGRRPEGIERPRHLGRAGVARVAPALDPGRLVGAVQYHDAIVDDARHTMTVARTAAGHGAVIATSVEVTGMLREGATVAGVRARDRETGQELAVRARRVVNATGVWADLVQQLAGEASVEVRPAKGIHLVVPRDRIEAHAALIAPTADSVLVVRPWWRYWIIGTTDTPWAHDRADPAASGADVDYLLGQVNGWLRAPLERRDVVGVFAGVRPLLRGKGGASTAALSRNHAVLEGPPGLITVTGGKYTTYRVMARDAVDAAMRSMGSPVVPCVTASTPLVGAEGWAALRRERDQLAARAGLPPATIEHLLRRYGALVAEVLELLARRPELRRPLAGAPEYLEAEIVYAATHEGALHVDDALARRTHVAMETADRGLEAAGRTAEIMGDVLGWDAARRAREVAAYRRAVEADLRSEQAPDDGAAVAARNADPGERRVTELAR